MSYSSTMKIARLDKHCKNISPQLDPNLNWHCIVYDTEIFVGSYACNLWSRFPSVIKIFENAKKNQQLEQFAVSSCDFCKDNVSYACNCIQWKHHNSIFKILRVFSCRKDSSIVALLGSPPRDKILNPVTVFTTLRPSMCFEFTTCFLHPSLNVSRSLGLPFWKLGSLARSHHYKACASPHIHSMFVVYKFTECNFIKISACQILIR